jgi:hypothetical protein
MVGGCVPPPGCIEDEMISEHDHLDRVGQVAEPGERHGGDGDRRVYPGRHHHAERRPGQLSTDLGHFFPAGDTIRVQGNGMIYLAGKIAIH